MRLRIVEDFPGEVTTRGPALLDDIGRALGIAPESAPAAPCACGEHLPHHDGLGDLAKAMGTTEGQEEGRHQTPAVRQIQDRFMQLYQRRLRRMMTDIDAELDRMANGQGGAQ